MAVEEKTQTAEEKNAETREVETRKRNAANALLASMEFPVDDKDKPKKGKESEEEGKEGAKKKGKEEEVIEADVSDEELLDIPDEDLTEEGIARKRELEEDPSKAKKKGDEEEEEEQLIPKSKHEKIVKKLERRIKSETRKAKTAKHDAPAADPVIARLEKMSDSELMAAKRKCRKAQLKAQSKIDKGDEKGETELEDMLELEEQIEQVRRDAPAKFHRQQAVLMQEKLEEIHDDDEIEDPEAAEPEIIAIAKQIFQSKKSLQGLVDGQAMAIEYAIEKYKLLGQAKSSTKKTRYLKQKVNKFKRKTNLDTNKFKRSKDETPSQKLKDLRSKAFRGGDLTDKAELIKIDPAFGVDKFIPEELKEQ